MLAGPWALLVLGLLNFTHDPATCAKKRLLKHGAKRVVVMLGAYGSLTPKPVACLKNYWVHICVQCNFCQNPPTLL